MLLTLQPPVIDRLRERDPGQGEDDSLTTIPGTPVSARGYLRGRIAPNQSLTAALRGLGVDDPALPNAIAALSTHFDFRRAQPGHEFEADIDPEGQLRWLRYRVSPEVVFEARRQREGGWLSSPVEVQLTTQVHGLAGSIRSSLAASLDAQGEGPALAQRLVDVFQWDIDFSRHVREGDGYRLVFEKVMLDGEFLRYGRILAAEYRGARRQLVAYWFEHDGQGGYRGGDSRPLERLFLAAPCAYTRISSPFDPHRVHPVLGVRRPHWGVDYAAPTGTPVMAMASGVVTFVGPRGGNGNLVSIRHEHGFQTGYAHLHRFARGLRAGQTVRQGQVIGYVGTTGLSTGPHLHYALKRNGRFLDPLLDHEVRRPQLTGRARREFDRIRSQLDVALQQLPLPDVTLESEPGEIEGVERSTMDFVDGEFASGEF
jgi:murein DD-endopeptidase MepM/ murein hydrolase activator NlpD